MLGNGTHGSFCRIVNYKGKKHSFDIFLKKVSYFTHLYNFRRLGYNINRLALSQICNF